MEYVAFLGWYGVGKSTYARERIVEDKKEGIRSARLAFADPVKQHIAERFNLDINKFYSDAKDNEFIPWAHFTKKERSILMKIPSPKMIYDQAVLWFKDEISFKRMMLNLLGLSYRQLLLRWSAHVKSTNEHFYLNRFIQRAEALEKDGYTRLYVDDLRLDIEFEYLDLMNVKYILLMREGISKPVISDSFMVQMEKAIRRYKDQIEYTVIPNKA